MNKNKDNGRLGRREQTRRSSTVPRHHERFISIGAQTIRVLSRYPRHSPRSVHQNVDLNKQGSSTGVDTNTSTGIEYHNDVRIKDVAIVDRHGNLPHDGTFRFNNSSGSIEVDRSSNDRAAADRHHNLNAFDVNHYVLELEAERTNDNQLFGSSNELSRSHGSEELFTGNRNDSLNSPNPASAGNYSERNENDGLRSRQTNQIVTERIEPTTVGLRSGEFAKNGAGGVNRVGVPYVARSRERLPKNRAMNVKTPTIYRGRDHHGTLTAQRLDYNYSLFLSAGAAGETVSSLGGSVCNVRACSNEGEVQRDVGGEVQGSIEHERYEKDRRYLSADHVGEPTSRLQSQHNNRIGDKGALSDNTIAHPRQLRRPRNDKPVDVSCSFAGSPHKYAKDVNSCSTSVLNVDDNQTLSVSDGKVPVLVMKDTCIDCGKKFLSFVFSTIGLTILLVGYTTVGGFVFQSLEAPNEGRTRNDMAITRRQFVEKLWNLTESLNILHPISWSEMAEQLLKNYTTDVFAATKKMGWDGTDGKDKDIQWSFPGAMLYSVTVITTIGYGHITPKTDAGRMVTMVYAIVGIPLTLLTIANLGGFMATSFRLFYKNISAVGCLICCRLCCAFNRCSSNKNRCCRNCCWTSLKPRHRKPTSAYREREYNIISKKEVCDDSSTNFSNIVPANSDHLRIEDIEDENLTDFEQDPVHKNKQITQTYYRSENWLVRLRRAIYTALDDVDSVRVPAHVTILLLIGYIVLGAVMFSTWEKDDEEWTFLIGCYFCFITLSTIGFGDFVPGTGPFAEQQKLVICALYLLIGLALIAMCFNLIQEEVRENVRSLAQKLGLMPASETPLSAGGVPMTSACSTAPVLVASDTELCLGDEERPPVSPLHIVSPLPPM